MFTKLHTKSYNNNDRLFFLLNPNEDIAENDPVRVVDAIVENLDLRDFKKLYRERGRCAYHPKMMLKIILYAYMNNIYSCRKIERQVQRIDIKGCQHSFGRQPSCFFDPPVRIISVELEGIEPSSKRGTNKLSTCLVCDLVFVHRQDHDFQPIP